jgi:hypothetical protein
MYKILSNPRDFVGELAKEGRKFDAINLKIKMFMLTRPETEAGFKRIWYEHC